MPTTLDDVSREAVEIFTMRARLQARQHHFPATLVRALEAGFTPKEVADAAGMDMTTLVTAIGHTRFVAIDAPAVRALTAQAPIPVDVVRA